MAYPTASSCFLTVFDCLIIRVLHVVCCTVIEQNNLGRALPVIVNSNHCDVFHCTLFPQLLHTPVSIRVDNDKEISTNFYVILTYFFILIWMGQKLASFRFTFFNIILMGEKSTFCRCMLFYVTSISKKLTSTLFQ